MFVCRSRSIGSCRETISLAGDELKVIQPALVGRLDQAAVSEHEAAITEIVFKRAK
jgi:hypothetical protein